MATNISQAVEAAIYIYSHSDNPSEFGDYTCEAAWQLASLTAHNQGRSMAYYASRIHDWFIQMKIWDSRYTLPSPVMATWYEPAHQPTNSGVQILGTDELPVQSTWVKTPKITEMRLQCLACQWDGKRCFVSEGTAKCNQCWEPSKFCSFEAANSSKP